jgi:hypothetical protein
MDSRGETVTDIVDLLDAMFTDDEFHSDSRLLVTIQAADEIARLRVELEEAKELLADSLPRLVDAIRLRAENVSLRAKIASLRLDAALLIQDLDGPWPSDPDVTFP